MVTFKLQVAFKDDPYVEDFTRDCLVTVTDPHAPLRPYDRTWEIVFERLQEQMVELWPDKGEVR